MDREAPSEHGESLREIRPRERGDAEWALLEAVLHSVGERGYDRVTLGEVAARAGTDERGFHRHFANLADCFAEAYGVLADWLCEELLAVGNSGRDWRDGYKRSLNRFLELAQQHRCLMGVLLVEHHAAGGRTVAKHAEVLGRLAEALDRGRCDLENRDEPPRLTPQLLLGAIEFATRELVLRSRGQQTGDIHESLYYLGVLLYQGREAANEQIEG